MTSINLPHVQSFMDRHGKVRRYFRKKSKNYGALPGEVGTQQFIAAYQKALVASSMPQPAGKSGIITGSLLHLASEYFKSVEFHNLRPSTQRTYRNSISRLTTKYGHLSVKGVESKHLRKIFDQYVDRPGAGYDARRVLMILMRFAHERGWRKDNPALGIKAPKQRNVGFEAWNEEDIAQFQAYWPDGSRENLALKLLLFTGQRRSDVVSMGRQFVSDGKIAVKQMKTGTRLRIPIHSDLDAALSLVPKGQLTYLQTVAGKPFSAAGFTNWFVAARKKAGVRDNLTPHGLRKATARRLAEAGCSAHQIASITGHKTLGEVARYAASANQEQMAKTAMESIARTKAVKPAG